MIFLKFNFSFFFQDRVSRRCCGCPWAHSVYQTVLELEPTLWSRPSFNSQRSTSLCFLTAGIKCPITFLVYKNVDKFVYSIFFKHNPEEKKMWRWTYIILTVRWSIWTWQKFLLKKFHAMYFNHIFFFFPDPSHLPTGPVLRSVFLSLSKQKQTARRRRKTRNIHKNTHRNTQMKAKVNKQKDQ